MNRKIVDHSTAFLLFFLTIIGQNAKSQCALVSSFTTSQLGNGNVQFTSTSSGTFSWTLYLWDFGDGTTTIAGPTTSHTYSNGGVHNVGLLVQNGNIPGCQDSTGTTINITSIPCQAISNFTMNMLSSGYWNASPVYPWNVSAASWDWGDNTTSNTLYTIHNYSPTGVYNVCLSVTVSCNLSSTTCLTYTITKSSTPITMAFIQVVPPQNLPITLNEPKLIKESDFIIYPNPFDGDFHLKFIGFNEKEAAIKIYNLTGALVYEAKGNIQNGNLDHEIKLEKAQGVYFVKIEAGSGVITKKIILKD